MRKILPKICAAWAALFFVCTMLPVLPFILLCGLWPDPARSRKMQLVFQAWMKVWFTGVGVRRRFRGRSHFAPGETYVVVCNHRSLLDPPLSSPGIPGANKTIAKVEMARIPLFGIIYKRGSVLVDRKSEDSRKASYMQMKQVLEEGMHMCIYPEGTRNKTAQPLTPFHDGAFRLAIDAGKAVIPAVIFNTRTVMPPEESFYFRLHPVDMHFLAPVSPVGKTVAELKAEVYEIMHRYLVAHGHITGKEKLQQPA